MSTARFVDLESAVPDEVVVVVDVLRAFTTQAWMLARGAQRIIAFADADAAVAVRDRHLPQALLAGERDGRPIAGFDLGNSPGQVAARDLADAVILHRTSAGTQGLAATVDGSGRVFAASFVTASATADALARLAPRRVTYVITGASRGRDGDEDLAAAELIAERVAGRGPHPAPYLARVAASHAGQAFTDASQDWAPPEDLALALELDRFPTALAATPGPGIAGPGTAEIAAYRAAHP